MSQNTKYEITYIIRPNIDEEAKTALVERFDTILKDNGAEIIDSKDWEKRRFAYEMNGFRLAKINDDIIRHMIVKIEE